MTKRRFIENSRCSASAQQQVIGSRECTITATFLQAVYLHTYALHRSSSYGRASASFQLKLPLGLLSDDRTSINIGYVIALIADNTMPARADEKKKEKKRCSLNLYLPAAISSTSSLVLGPLENAGARQKEPPVFHSTSLAFQSCHCACIRCLIVSGG